MTRLHRFLPVCALALLVGCFSGVPVEEQVRSQLTSAHGFEQLTLTETSDGGFTGTGTTAAGTTWDVRVKYYPDSKLKMEYKLSRPGGSLTKWGNIFIR